MSRPGITTVNVPNALVSSIARLVTSGHPLARSRDAFVQNAVSIVLMAIGDSTFLPLVQASVNQLVEEGSSLDIVDP
jgi:hypothetical protein